ncbi:MAG TPA: O-antigen ligase family protein [Thermoanaerobaculia bacterium]|jgi:hypothetical protein
MQPITRWIPAAERACLGVLFAWLVWLPLPFGSVIERARLPLLAVPFALCTAAALLRLYAIRERTHTPQPTRAWQIWSNGTALFLAVAALQLVPLPPSLLGALSPESASIWNGAAPIAALAGAPVARAHPVSVDPAATTLELLRFAALLATFSICALLVRTHARRVALAAVLCAAATFESLYGVREAALQRYEIWGWVNRLIYNRVTGTFVNPNHFAHYLAIVLPMSLFLIATAVRHAAPPETPFGRRIALLLEQHAAVTGLATLAAIVCAAGVLLAASRGALLSLAAGMFAVSAALPGRRVARAAFGTAAGLAILVALILFLGPARTVSRFAPNELERQTFVGRRVGIGSGIDVWQRFAILGSGLGTFDRVVSMEQRSDLEKVYNHAHNDYVELAATTGTAGFMIAFVTLAAGYVALARMTFSAAARQELAWRRRAYQVAALTSITIAAVHALFDFNLFIPANPATLAAIAGAAVAVTHHDKRIRR